MENKFTTTLKVMHQTLIIFALSFFFESAFFRHQKQMNWTAMWTLLPLIVLSCVLYYTVKRFWLYIIVQIVLAALFISLPGRIIFGYVLAYIFCLSIQITDKKSDAAYLMEPGWRFCFVLAAVYAMALWFERETITQFIPYVLMLYIIITILFLNYVGLFGFLSVRKNVKNIQMGQLLRVNSSFIGIVLGLCAFLFCFVGFFMDNSPIIWAVRQIGELLRRFFRSLWGKTSASVSEVPDYALPDAETAESPLASMREPDSVSMQINEVMYWSIAIIFITIALVIVIIALVKLIKLLIRRFAEKKELQADDSVIEDEIISIKPVAIKRNREVARTPAEKLRKVYRKEVDRIRREKGISVLPIDATPTDIDIECFGEVREEAHELYSRARYGQGVSDDDVVRYKSLINH